MQRRVVGRDGAVPPLEQQVLPGKCHRQADLERIAQAGGGRAYIGDPDTIEAVYAQIASFF